jgi:hypothetical protein
MPLTPLAAACSGGIVTDPGPGASRVIAVAGGAEGLKHQWSEYVPAYRSPAGTGTGLAFGLWC